MQMQGTGPGGWRLGVWGPGLGEGQGDLGAGLTGSSTGGGCPADLWDLPCRRPDTSFLWFTLPYKTMKFIL